MSAPDLPEVAAFFDAPPVVDHQAARFARACKAITDLANDHLGDGVIDDQLAEQLAAAALDLDGAA